MNGKIIGVGIGPGDPDLVTLRAIHVLREAHVVVAPRAREDTDSLALRIAKNHIGDSCEIREVCFPMTKDENTLNSSWKNAAQEILTLAQHGKTVAFITLGDAMLYSTWGYVLREVRELDPHVSVSTVPGITAMAACAAQIGEPLAEGDTPLLVWPGNPSAQIPLKNTNCVFMKASRHLKKIESIVEANEGKCVALRNCCLPNQEITHDLSMWQNDTQYFTTVLSWCARGEKMK